ncbi:MAG: TPM domain-containing protein, partial [Candidatus Omnitrophota bacterium]|nr:TPM domain-containing protein [Candidatus Omnitrophota bacterium]
KAFMKKIFIIAAFFIFTGIGFCEEPRFQNYAGYVNDYAGILSDETKAKLAALSAEIETKTTSQLAILTLDTTAPLDIETYAVKLFEKWGIGQKGKDNGVLILVAVKDKQVRIEVGYGLEGAIPDALAKNIIEKSMLPFFKSGDYNAGILQGTAVVSKLIAGEYHVEISELENIKIAASSKQPSISDFLLFIIFVIIILIRARLFWFFPMLGRGSGKGGGYWSGPGSSGGFGGGFGGFGGGFSGGGGASGRW